MKFIFQIFISALLILAGCSTIQSENSQLNLSPTAFKEKLLLLPEAVLLDVRTPEEFAKGHLENAMNVDWNGDNFDAQLSNIDKSKPVFVYCLSGGRSSSAAAKMRADGFKEVYELKGGIMKWRSENLPESIKNNGTGMSRSQFDELLKNEKLVLIDFYAEWCAPCKKMKPYLEEISKDMAGQVEVVRINADDNQNLCKELNIDALPVLQLYRNKAMVWNNEGFIEKDKVVSKINEQK